MASAPKMAEFSESASMLNGTRKVLDSFVPLRFDLSARNR